MTRPHADHSRARLVALGAALVLLTACGSGNEAGNVSVAGRGANVANSLLLSAEPAECDTSSTGPTCRVKIWYSNTSQLDLAVDASLTRLVDALGTLRVGSSAPGTPSPLVLAPLGQTSVTWTVRLPLGATLVEAVWQSTSGRAVSVPVVMQDAVPSAEPTPVQTTSAAPSAPTATPTPTAKPKPKPTPTRTPAPTRTRTSNPGPPVSGSIG